MKIIDFILMYWQPILGALLSVVGFVIVLIRKKPSYNEFDNILLKVIERIPGFICGAEEIYSQDPKSGEAKKALVMSCITRFIKDQFSITLPDTLLSFLDKYVESILVTPQKKEGDI